MGGLLLHWLLTIISGIALLLAVVTVLLSKGNAELQQNVNSRQALIQQGQQVDLPLYRELVQTLAELAVKGDAQIGSMMTDQGLKISGPPPATAAPAQPPAAKEDKKANPQRIPKP